MASARKKSRKRSATKSLSPPDPVFFADRNLGNKIFPNLVRPNTRLEIHDDHFSRDEKDENWLAEIGKRGWVVLTKDKAIRYRKTELTAYMVHNVRMFVLPGDLTAQDLADLFIGALPRVRRMLAKHNSPFIARIYKSGEVKISHEYTDAQKQLDF